jgi:hypothetical protein
MKSIESIIEKEVRRWELQKLRAQEEKQAILPYSPVITVARQYGAEGEKIAEGISEVTGFQLYDKELLEAIANDFGVQAKLIEMLDEISRSELESWFEGIIRGRIIDNSDYIASLTKTLGAIAKHGKAVIVGRGANIILGLCRGFHIRVVASKEVRAYRISKELGVPGKEARHMIDEGDEQRVNFIKRSFGLDANDPTAFDLVINTDILSHSDAIKIAIVAYDNKRKYLLRRS